MAKPPSKPPRQSWRLSRFLQARWRLLVSTVLCVLLVVFLPEGYLYFAFVIGTSTAVSDVEVTSRTIRKTVIVHGIVAFVFNVTLIALTVSIAADAISAK